MGLEPRPAVLLRRYADLFFRAAPLGDMRGPFCRRLSAFGWSVRLVTHVYSGGAVLARNADGLERQGPAGRSAQVQRCGRTETSRLLHL